MPEYLHFMVLVRAGRLKFVPAKRERSLACLFPQAGSVCGAKKGTSPVRSHLSFTPKVTHYAPHSSHCLLGIFGEFGILTQSFHPGKFQTKYKTKVYIQEVLITQCSPLCSFMSSPILSLTSKPPLSNWMICSKSQIYHCNGKCFCMYF